MRFHEPRSASRIALRALGAGALVLGVGALGAGCLTRPVQSGVPSTKTNFTAQVRQAAVDKVDLLFAIDNSASMGDKQALLSAAVPDLMNRLVSPFCLDDNGKNVGNTKSDGTCDTGKPEFPPVHDMHVGIVSSSLGGRGSDQCNPSSPNPTNTALNGHNDDQGHLLNRGGDSEAPVGDADQGSGSSFLAWFPGVSSNQSHPTPSKPITQVGTLNTDFQNLVVGVHQYGCGFEAQLESWYRFLIQPDPYASIDPPDKNGQVHLNGVDDVILQQRADFLRPDSLVAIIQLTDENESTVDPLALGGQGWAYENLQFPGSQSGGGAAKGTSACATDPNSDNCTSCGFCRGGSPAAICNDPACSDASKGYYTTAEDSLNERMFHMKQRFGVDPQFPASRYVTALTSHLVPDRNGEHPISGGNPSSNYVGTQNCSNPLFSTNLPKAFDSGNPDAICTLTPGPRTPDLVYYALIGGVPWQLLLQDTKDTANSPFKDAFTDSDWDGLIGHDPLNYDFSGADPHMIESTTPRQGINSNDPIVGRDWNTNGSDLEYACTFPLDAPRDCTTAENKFACDCDGRDSPLCDPTNNKTQLRGKAYPTIKELSIVRAMKDQGVVASLCPRTDASGNLLPKSADDYGYRPAVRSIINRLKNALANQCLPQKLIADTSGQVPCLILLTLTGSPVGAAETTCTDHGFLIPDPAILAKFRQNQHDEWVAQGGQKTGAPDPSQYPTCQLQQLVKAPGDTCANDTGAGWCYVQNANGNKPAGTCSQAILFTSAGNPAGATISLQCIENAALDAGTD